ncbi:radical SAM protein [Clostridium estertheticum]|uniref:SPL family radical SAM protein n=1 Tax=Clostridium estertheticum TaxID=238834 RepID=UPI001CF35C4B|nr:radical SAM protein [Clostridium estertheticum]MCB2308177.1 radical SAM protein [Clostridium estertheticum]MCB2346244.1 radical SAM protein [Clostridium estertheticum]MCB2349564.1 radical SAM protein [Clostridium estertheticum]WAG47894.1 radical SAM protein [Clostridium estertheticum]
MNFIPAKTIVSGYSDTNNNWFGNNYNMNIYKGCCHGCIYCDSRSDCYHIDNFDEVRAKENTLALINHDLKSKRKTGVIATGAMSDPYNPLEKEYKLTRGALELINIYGFGVSIYTKSNLIRRDIDILSKIQTHSPVIINITITTCDDELCKKIEPNAPLSSKRFAAVKDLTTNGIFAGILLTPVLPFLEDNEENIGSIIRLAYESGAKFIYPSFGVTLRQNQRTWYYKKLDELFPTLKQKYINQYDNNYECHSAKASELKQFFQKECDKLGLLYKMKDIIEGYRHGYGNTQLSLFD